MAVGITATQLELGSLIECLAAWFLALSGLLCAWLHLRLAMQPAWPSLVRGLWAVVSLSLFGSMILAAMYGSRTYAAVAWLNIPWMRALHGTTNAIGFGLAGLLAWSWVNVGEEWTHEDAIELETNEWRVEPLHLEKVYSSYFADTNRFPEGTAEFDHALIMRNISHEWHVAS